MPIVTGNAVHLLMLLAHQVLMHTTPHMVFTHVAAVLAILSWRFRSDFDVAVGVVVMIVIDGHVVLGNLRQRK